MATLGLSKLDAVNRLLWSINERPVSALQTGGSAIESDAERFLDDTNQSIQSHGWPENTNFYEPFTPTGAGLINVPSDTLVIRSTGANEYRTLVLQGDAVYDMDRFTLNLGTDLLYFDRIRLLGFVDCSPKLKELITTTAMVYFQQRVRGSATQDAMLQQARALADIMADRTPTKFSHWPTNLRPLIELMQPSQGRGNA